MRWGGPLRFRIYCICYHSSKLREVITGDLLPSSAMVKDLSQELGLPILQEGLTDGKPSVLPTPPTPNLEDFRGQKSDLAYEIQAHQEKYLRWRNAMVLKNRGQERSLIQVGTLSSPGQGSQAFAPPGLSSHHGGYRAEDQFLYLHSWDPGQVA